MSSLELDIPCLFRSHIRQERGREVATCLLLQQITQLDSPQCTVDRSACEVCCRAFPTPGAALNPVLPSLLFNVCDSAARRSPAAAETSASNSAPVDQPAHLIRLRRWAAQHIDRPQPERYWTHGCDVIVCCQSADRRAEAALQSVLAQENVFPVVHLIDDGGAEPLLRQYRHHPQVIVHRNPRSCGPWATLQRLVPKLRTPFVALQDPTTVSRPQRLATAIAMMDERGGEIFGSALQVGREIVDVQQPAECYRRYLPSETLVFRRSSLIDMGGFAEHRPDPDAEVVHRAKAESRTIISCSLPLVDRMVPRANSSLGPSPTYGPVGSHVSLRGHAAGFTQTRASCDVVLPFFDRPDFVDQALEGLLRQQEVDLLIHLVDDCGPVGSDVFARWRGHPSVRLYRNRKNIGPFASFNNLVEHFETGLAAVQDADDVSHPHRMSQSANWLRLAGADIFGGRCRMFGSDSIICPTHEDANDRRLGPCPEFKASVYPRPGIGYFLQNPTAMVRVDAFRQLGGYANFRDRQRNRTGVDTELFARAYYAGCRFAITRDVVVDYRVHGESATQSPHSEWGSDARAEAVQERRRRIRMFRAAGAFDPRTFGALSDFAGVTEKVSSVVRAS